MKSLYENMKVSNQFYGKRSSSKQSARSLVTQLKKLQRNYDNFRSKRDLRPFVSSCLEKLDGLDEHLSSNPPVLSHVIESSYKGLIAAYESILDSLIAFQKGSNISFSHLYSALNDIFSFYESFYASAEPWSDDFRFFGGTNFPSLPENGELDDEFYSFADDDFSAAGGSLSCDYDNVGVESNREALRSVTPWHLYWQLIRIDVSLLILQNKKIFEDKSASQTIDQWKAFLDAYTLGSITIQGVGSIESDFDTEIESFVSICQQVVNHQFPSADEVSLLNATKGSLYRIGKLLSTMSYDGCPSLSQDFLASVQPYKSNDSLKDYFQGHAES